jgi:hypothetical protein
MSNPLLINNASAKTNPADHGNTSIRLATKTAKGAPPLAKAFSGIAYSRGWGDTARTKLLDKSCVVGQHITKVHTQKILYFLRAQRLNRDPPGWFFSFKYLKRVIPPQQPRHAQRFQTIACPALDQLRLIFALLTQLAPPRRGLSRRHFLAFFRLRHSLVTLHGANYTK